MTDLSPLAELGIRHLRAKANEATYKADRQAIESKIVAITGLKESGQSTHNQGGYKFTVAPTYAYVIDLAEWDKIADQIPEALHPIKTKREADPAKIRQLRAQHPELYRLISRVLTKKSNRPSVDVSEVSQ